MGHFKGEHRFGKFSRRDAPPSRGRSSDRFERGDQEQSFEKRMHEATCAKCGQRCEIPFQPREGKPVYCSICFRSEGMYGSKRPGSANSERSDLDKINEKLDKIMKALDVQ